VIEMTWIGGTPEPRELMRGTASQLELVFGLEARVGPAADPPDALDPRRGQHSSTAILRWLEARARAPLRLLAVTDADLFIPVLTFVFGEARLGGRAAVVSLARLGDGRRPHLTRARLAKVAVHEVGHLFGLVHCLRAGCAMTRSSTAGDVDLKSGRFCPDCRMRLAEARSPAVEAS
jgi:archaemetzincin